MKLNNIINDNIIGALRWNVLLLLKCIRIHLSIIDIAMNNETTISFFLPLYRELRYRQFLPEPQTSPISLASGRNPHANRRESRNMQMIIILKRLRHISFFFVFATFCVVACMIAWIIIYDNRKYNIFKKEF